ncbi:MAG TPA: glutathione S-transferase family protein [Noviherbaspirillum sp.]|nr:glutathione S-transferase family protein [Noviherbaspirillum sp.]
MHPTFTLISHPLCPYVQRAAIVLREKGVAFTRREIELADKPNWFLAISPLGKTPVLLVDETPIFESMVICEYLDETVGERLHPHNALLRARHRAWIEFGSSILNVIGSFYSVHDEAALQRAKAEIRTKFVLLEAALAEGGPFFEAERFSMIDAVYGPIFRYFATFERIGESGFFDGLEKLAGWRTALLTRASVRDAVRADYGDLLLAFLKARNSALSSRILSVGAG